MPTVLITAGAKNTGFAIAEKFAENGYDVAITSRSSEEIAKAAAAIREKYGVKVKGYTMELTDVAGIRAVFAEIKADFGRLDTFVANAANLGVGNDFLDIDEDEYNSVIDVNLKGSFFSAQEAAHHEGAGKRRRDRLHELGALASVHLRALALFRIQGRHQHPHARHGN